MENTISPLTTTPNTPAMRFADKRYTVQNTIRIYATYYCASARKCIERSATLVCLAYRKLWYKSHPSYRAAIDNQLAEWMAFYGTGPVTYGVF